jgi:hypothetical protein
MAISPALATLPLVKIGPRLRWKLHYRVAQAGAKRGWGRSQSYREAVAGNIPGLVRFTPKGGILGVRKTAFDRELAKVLKAAR